jgi:hypothetical protein
MTLSAIRPPAISPRFSGMTAFVYDEQKDTSRFNRKVLMELVMFSRQGAGTHIMLNKDPMEIQSGDFVIIDSFGSGHRKFDTVLREALGATRYNYMKMVANESFRRMLAESIGIAQRPRPVDPSSAGHVEQVNAKIAEKLGYKFMDMPTMVEQGRHLVMEYGSDEQQFEVTAALKSLGAEAIHKPGNRNLRYNLDGVSVMVLDRTNDTFS